MDQTPQDPDPIDVDAAGIDARSPEAAQEIEQLEEHAEELGREPSQPIDPDAGPPEATGTHPD